MLDGIKVDILYVHDMLLACTILFLTNLRFHPVEIDSQRKSSYRSKGKYRFTNQMSTLLKLNVSPYINLTLTSGRSTSLSMHYSVLVLMAYRYVLEHLV